MTDLAIVCPTHLRFKRRCRAHWDPATLRLTDHGYFCPKRKDRPVVTQSHAWPLIVEMVARTPVGWWRTV